MKIIGNNTYQNIQTSVTKFKSVQRGLLHADKRKINIIFWRSSLHNTNLSYLTSYPPNKISAKYVSEHLDKRKTILIQIPLKSQKQDFKTTIKYYNQHASLCTFGSIQTFFWTIYNKRTQICIYMYNTIMYCIKFMYRLSTYSIFNIIFIYLFILYI